MSVRYAETAPEVRGGRGPSRRRRVAGDIMPAVSTQELRTPLYDEHVALGARMVEFAGYSMPVQYQSVIAETKAVREGAGMFDVSHMARLTFTGPRTLEYLEQVTANDVSKLEDGHGQYSMLPNAQGGIVDDIIVYRIGPAEYRLVVNAANHAKDVAHLKALNAYDVAMADTTDATAMIAVQGPKAIGIVAELSDNPELLKSMSMFMTANVKVSCADCFVAYSGYTGEEGFELVCPAEQAPALWKALMAAGVSPSGLGARDALRVEAGLPLYGHELKDDLSPMAAGLGWAISKTKSFLGSEFINKARAEGTPQKLQGVKLGSKRLPTPGMTVLVEGKPVGTVSSGVYSPLLECGIAFAFIDASIKLNTPCALDMRGKPEPATVVSKRFFKRA